MTDRIKTVTLLCGFFVIFAGVYLLNFSSNKSQGRGFSCERSLEENGSGFFCPMSSSLDSGRSSEETRVEDVQKGLMESYEVEESGLELHEYETQSRH
jgi:hypothetical protein